MTAQPIDQCLAIHDGKPRLTNTKDFNHVNKIPLDHIPPKFQLDYRALLRSHSKCVFKKRPRPKTLQGLATPSATF